MPLFGKSKEEKQSVQVNQLSELVRYNHLGWWWKNVDIKPYHRLILFTILNQIYKGMQNVTFLNQKNHNFLIDTIISFIESNYVALLDQYWTLGFMCISCDKYLHIRITPEKDIQYDKNGRVVTKNTIVVYSPQYQTNRLSDIKIIRPWLDIIDNLGSSLDNGTKNMGVLPIISGDSIPANPDFKRDLSDMMSRDYGSSNKFPYFLSKTKLDVQTIDLNLKDLEISDNMTEEFKYISRFFGVPTDLIVGGSTFTNSSEAKLWFYDTTIRSYAELFLQLGQTIITMYTELPKNSLNYKIYNIAGLDKSLSDMIKEKKEMLEILVSLKEQGVDVKNDIDQIYQDLKLAYKEV